MLTELLGKGGRLCQPAREGSLRCPLIVRPTSEDVITGHLFESLQLINPRWWLPSLLNEALGGPRFRQQAYRKLEIRLWQNQPPYPRSMLPWAEGSTQVDAVISWENPPTTVFVEMKFMSGLSPKTSRDDGHQSYPSDQLIRNARVGLMHTGWLQAEQLFRSPPRDFVLLVVSPHRGHELVQRYRDTERLKASIPHSDKLVGLPRLPFLGEIGFREVCGVLARHRRWMTKVERSISDKLTTYLEHKLDQMRIKQAEQSSLLPLLGASLGEDERVNSEILE